MSFSQLLFFPLLLIYIICYTLGVSVSILFLDSVVKWDKMSLRLILCFTPDLWRRFKIQVILGFYWASKASPYTLASLN